jgi:hypothetical protein
MKDMLQMTRLDIKALEQAAEEGEGVSASRKVSFYNWEIQVEGP